jgi:DNA-binding NarL/FixJ family response regulator
VLVERGELADAMRVVERAGLSDDLPATYQSGLVLDSRGRLRVAQGRVREGIADLLAAGERMLALHAPNPAPLAWRSSAALALLQVDEVGEARRLASEELERARAWGAPRALGRALRVAGVVAGREGLSLLREAVEVLTASSANLELAYALTAFGSALRRQSRRTEARVALATGLDLAHRCGADSLAEQARTELLATGARPRRVARRGVDSLTPSELRVARMAADGQTNREIAQALFVTASTVETHLSNVYRKLGIRARSQLAQALDIHS